MTERRMRRARELLAMVVFVVAFSGCGRIWYTPIGLDAGGGGGGGRPGADAATESSTDAAADAPAMETSGGDAGADAPTSETSGGDAGADAPISETSGGDAGADASISETSDDGSGGGTAGSDGGGIDGSGGVGGTAGATGGASGAGGIDGGGSGIDGGGSGAICTVASNGGHAYAFCSGPLPWSDAANDCALKGMHLARIDDSQENDWIQASAFVGLPANENSLPVWRWLGASDQAVEGEWRWSDGTLFWLGAANGAAQGGLFENWASSQPSDSGGAEDCAAIQHNPTGSGVWSDIGCGLLQAYVCEQ